MTATTPIAVKGRKLKIAFGELIGLVGGLEAAAACCRVNKSALGRYASLGSGDESYFAPIDVVRCLEAVCGAPVVTEVLAAEMGGGFVALPAVPAGQGDLLSLLAAQSREASDVTNALCLGLADGRLCGAEARKALAEVDQLLRVAMQMRAELTVICGEDA